MARFFLNTYKSMIKKVLLFSFLIACISINAQKAQRFGYVDMEYILENIPEYIEAETKINTKAITWQNNIENQQKEIDELKADLSNEKALLTKELVEERQEDILIKELELKKLQAAYFGTNGDLFFLRKQLVKPIQDLVYNAIQDIATKRKYDFVLDKSTDLIMLYSNKQYDISDIVLASIKRIKKSNEANAKKNKNKKGEGATNSTQTKVVSEEAQKKIDDKEAKRAEMLKRIEDQRAAELKKRKELLKANEERKLKRKKEIEEAKKAKEQKNN